MNIEQAIKDLQETAIVMAEIEKRQSKLLREHAEIIADHDRHVGELLEFRRRTDQNLTEITDKLNGLIGYVANFPPPAPPTSPA